MKDEGSSMPHGDISLLFCPLTPSLTLGGGCTTRAILSFCVNPVSGELLRGLDYMSHTDTYTCTQVS